MEPRPGYTQRHEVKVTHRHGQGHSYQSQSSMEQRPGYTETQGQGHIETTSRSYRDKGEVTKRHKVKVTQRHRVKVTETRSKSYTSVSVIAGTTPWIYRDTRSRSHRDKVKVTNVGLSSSAAHAAHTVTNSRETDSDVTERQTQRQ